MTIGSNRLKMKGCAMKKIVKGCFCLVSVLAAGIVRASVPFDGLAAAVDAAADGAVIELDEGEYTISAELVLSLIHI